MIDVYRSFKIPMIDVYRSFQNTLTLEEHMADFQLRRNAMLLKNLKYY
jgi:hypothetical protein